MKRLHKLVAGLVLAAMAIGTIGIFATASAANTRLVIVNGRAGPAVAVCIDGNKVVKRLAYGGKVVRFTNNDPHTLKFVASGKGCGSKSLGKQSFDADASGADGTIVLTKRAPDRVTVWDNEDINEGVAPGDAAFSWRHAADIGPAIFKYSIIQSDTIGPSATGSPLPVWVKGDELSENLGQEDILLKLKATRPGRVGAIAKNGDFRRYRSNHRTESILVGHKLRNVRFVNVRVKNRPGATASPTATP